MTTPKGARIVTTGRRPILVWMLFCAAIPAGCSVERRGTVPAISAAPHGPCPAPASEERPTPPPQPQAMRGHIGMCME